MRDEGTGDHVRPILNGDLDATGGARVLLGGLHVFADGVLLAEDFAAGVEHGMVSRGTCEWRGARYSRGETCEFRGTRKVRREGHVSCRERGMLRREGRVNCGLSGAAHSKMFCSDFVVPLLFAMSGARLPTL